MSEPRLSERLDDLAQLIEPPMVPIGDDLARGRRRLRRRRRVAVAATVGSVAAVGVIASMVPFTTSTSPQADVTGQPPASAPSSSGAAGTGEGGRGLREARLANRQIVAEHLDPGGRYLSDRAIHDLGSTPAPDSSRPARSSTERLVWQADGPSGDGTVRLTLERGRQTLCSAASGTGEDLRIVTCLEGELAGLPVTEIRDPGSTVPRLVYHRRDGVAVSVELDFGPSDLAATPAPRPPASVSDSLPADGSISEQQVADLLSDPALAIPTS